MRNVLIHFSIKYRGDYLKIVEAIKLKENVTEADLKEAEKCKDAITILDDNYPTLLRNSFAPPFVLFYKGDISLLERQPTLAVIGSRNPSEYGKKVTKKILEEIFEEKEIVVVSGLAKGIDSIAHKVSLNNNQKTIAVLGSGIDVCYPIENLSLYKDIEEYGLIVSEYPRGVSPDKKNFTLRNRIIAGLSKAILVTDASKISGTQNTVKHGIESNRDIMAIPHSILEESFCNYLIKQGAYPIFNGKDVIEQIF